MQTKLTLILDEELIKEVKSIANRQGQSVSKVENLFPGSGGELCRVMSANRKSRSQILQGKF
jgi:hypothetical protein